MVDLDQALAVARAAAAAAAEPIRRYYVEGAAVRIKADATPVTEADEAAEALIRSWLRAAYPDHGIYGEEGGAEGMERDWLWLIDPIDGTKAFVRGYPFFSTQIALWHQGRAVLGVSLAPVFGEEAYAREGGGAFVAGAPARVSDAARWDQAAISTGNLKTLARGPGWSRLAGLVAEAQRIRGYGDFLHYHLLAAGRVDLVIESDVNILDIAALSCIVREAGGVFTDFSGRQVDLASTSVLAGNPVLHERALHHFG